MTPPPFSFELIVTGLCLITLQADNFGNDVGAKFNFLDAPGGQTVCGEDFEDGHVAALTFDLEDLGDGSTTDYTSYRTPDGRYIGIYLLKDKNLCLSPVPETNAMGKPNHPFYIRRDAGPNPEKPTDPAYEDSLHWLASLKDVDDRIDPTSKPDSDSAKFAGTITVDEGTLMSSELGRDRTTSDLVVWEAKGGQPGDESDFPKALAGAMTLRLKNVHEQVELEDCDSEDPILIFRPKGQGPVRVVAANLPSQKATNAHNHPMSHFLWYYNLLKWKDGMPCPADAALPTPPVSLPPGDIGGITGSSVFCPPAMP